MAPCQATEEEAGTAKEDVRKSPLMVKADLDGLSSSITADEKWTGSGMTHDGRIPFEATVALGAKEGGQEIGDSVMKPWPETADTFSCCSV